MSIELGAFYHVVRPFPPHLEAPVIFLSKNDAQLFLDKFYSVWVEGNDAEGDDAEGGNRRTDPFFIHTFFGAQTFVQYTQQLQRQLQLDVEVVKHKMNEQANRNNNNNNSAAVSENGTNHDNLETAGRVSNSPKDNESSLSQEEKNTVDVSATVTNTSITTRKRKATAPEGENDRTKTQRTQVWGETEEANTPIKRKRGRPRTGEKPRNTRNRKRELSDGIHKEKWQKNLKLLHEYKEKHGTAFVKDELCINEFATLKNFFRSLKYNMRCFKGLTDRKPVKSFDEDMFNYAIGLGLKSVVESPVKNKNPKATDVPWEDMYQQLKEYFEQHGHPDVPKLPRTPLSNWCTLQKLYFQKLKQGKKTILTPERIGLLQKLGFKIEMNVRLSFDERAAQWLEYRTKHGKDPPTDSGALGQWVSGQRLKYRNFKEGKKERALTQEQVDRLTNWGFDWREEAWKPEGRGELKSWEERYEEILQFYNEHGHSKVKQQGPLGHWVHRQRREYTWMKTGRKHALTKEKLEKLRAVNFVFLTRKRPTRRNSKGRLVPIASVENPYDIESDENDSNSFDYVRLSDYQNNDKSKHSNNENKKKGNKAASDSGSSSSSDEEYDETEEE